MSAYQVPFGRAAFDARVESIVVAYGLLTAPTNWKLGVRQTIFTVFAPVGGIRKWKRTQSAFGAETTFCDLPPLVVLIVAVSTTPSGGFGTVNLVVVSPTFSVYAGGASLGGSVIVSFAEPAAPKE